VEAPQVAALSCKIILEAANASVTVSVADNSVQSFNLLDEPRLATEAWEEFAIHYGEEEGYRNESLRPWRYNETIRYM
jgi:hypothetical protein